MDTAPNPVPAYLASILRTVLGFIGGYLVSKGWITADQSPELIGAAVVVFTLAWGLIQKANAHKALKSAIASPAGIS